MMLGIRLSVNVGIQKTAALNLVEQGVSNDATGKFEFSLPDVCYTDKVDIVLPRNDRFNAVASDREVHYSFIDVAPLVFHKLRAFWSISPEFYSTSLGPERILGQLLVGNISSLAEQFSEGKSGSFFYYRLDCIYIFAHLFIFIFLTLFI